MTCRTPTKSKDLAITCTLVGGSRPWDTVYRTGSVDVALGEDAYLTWQDVDKGNTWGSYNFSCNVPPGVEMNHLVTIQTDTGDGL
jgi:hypothetical protein